MGLFSKIGEYIKLADQTMTEFSQDANILINGYQAVFATTHKNVNNLNMRFNAVKKLNFTEFLREGVYELDNIVKSAKKTLKTTYMSSKNIFKNFIQQRKNRKKEKNNFETYSTNLTESTDSIIKKDAYSHKKESSLDEIVKKESRKTTNYTTPLKYTNENKNSSKKDMCGTTYYVDDKRNLTSTSNANKIGLTISATEIKFPKIKYDLTNSYVSNISNIMKNHNSDISDLARTISGKYNVNKKKIWKWTDRVKLFNEYIQNNSAVQDKEGLLQIKKTLEKNKYLKRKQTRIYNQLIDSLDKLQRE